MKWVWQADSGGFTLVLCQSGLVYREVTFGWINSKNEAYESWGGKCIAKGQTMIETKRMLIDYIVDQISKATMQTKVEFAKDASK